VSTVRITFLPPRDSWQPYTFAWVGLNPAAILRPAQRKTQHNPHTAESALAVFHRLLCEEFLYRLAVDVRDRMASERRQGIGPQCVVVVSEAG